MVSDQKIIEAIEQSYTYTMAARMIGISKQALHKRALKLKKIRFKNGALCAIKTRQKRKKDE